MPMSPKRGGEERGEGMSMVGLVWPDSVANAARDPWIHTLGKGERQGGRVGRWV